MNVIFLSFFADMFPSLTFIPCLSLTPTIGISETWLMAVLSVPNNSTCIFLMSVPIRQFLFAWFWSQLWRHSELKQTNLCGSSLHLSVGSLCLLRPYWGYISGCIACMVASWRGLQILGPSLCAVHETSVLPDLWSCKCVSIEISRIVHLHVKSNT